MDIDISHNHLASPISLSEKITLLKQQTPAILEDFQKYYVFYNKNPEHNEYQQIFENIKKNMDQLKTREMPDILILGDDDNDDQIDFDELSKKTNDLIVSDLNAIFFLSINDSMN